MPKSEETRYEFKIGAAFPNRDEMARYVLRLSMALGDLRIASDYAVREAADHERLYFVRLLASHLRETVLLFDPPDRGIVPTVEDFIAALPPECRDLHAEPLRDSSERVLALLRQQFTLRPGLNLRNELKRMRNQFFHYHADRNSDADLGDALAASADDDGAYVVIKGDGGSEMRAQYADAVSWRLVHPFEGDDDSVRPVAEELHQRIIDLLDPLGTYLQAVEAAYLTSGPPGVITVVKPDGTRAEARRP